MKTYNIKLNERQIAIVVASLKGLKSTGNTGDVIQLQMMEQNAKARLESIQKRLNSELANQVTDEPQPVQSH